jgi:hypothetical protein
VLSEVFFAWNYLEASFRVKNFIILPHDAAFTVIARLDPPLQKMNNFLSGTQELG